MRAQVFITERFVDLMAEGIDVGFIVGRLQDPHLVPRVILTYHHRLLATPRYIEEHGMPRTPEDLPEHRLLAFSFRRAESAWHFVGVRENERRSITFRPYLSINDYAGMIPRLLAHAGIGEVPPLIQPKLVEEGQLVEVMPDWKFPNFQLKVVHLGTRYVPRVVRIFVDLAARWAPLLFPALPTSRDWADTKSTAASEWPKW